MATLQELQSPSSGSVQS